MRFFHPDLPGRGVRLGYCLNLYPAEDFDGVLAGLREVALPLAARFAGEGRRGFGVGLWLPMDVALELTVPDGEARLTTLVDLLAEEGLDAFTFNAFPAGGFHRPGLKERVFAPTWKAPERLAFTLAVAEVAIRARERGAPELGTGGGHVSISTHAGLFGADVAGPEDLDRCAENLCLAALQLARLEEERGVRVVLSLEPEPRSSANDTAELAAFHARLVERGQEVLARGFPALDRVSERIMRRHLGTCLDTCHAAVEFEAPGAAYANATPDGTTLGKLQFSSALAVEHPAANAAARARLLALDEPVYLHQVTGRGPDGLVRAVDLPELAARAADEPAWDAADEWRCHFHVPVDLGDLGGLTGLRTTRPEADALLTTVLNDPDRWGGEELHVEVETYTWDVLPGEARGTGERIDGLERELRHARSVLERSGWRPLRDG